MLGSDAGTSGHDSRDRYLANFFCEGLVAFALLRLSNRGPSGNAAFELALHTPSCVRRDVRLSDSPLILQHPP